MYFGNVRADITADYEGRGVSARQINEGLCLEWAERVFERLRGSVVSVAIWGTVPGLCTLDHCFVQIGGYFYDSELHEGSTDHMNLPCLKREGAVQPAMLFESNYPRRHPFKPFRGVDAATLHAHLIDLGADVPDYLTSGVYAA